jgi:hypothetical protein
MNGYDLLEIGNYRTTPSASNPVGPTILAIKFNRLMAFLCPPTRLNSETGAEKEKTWFR